MDNKDKFIEDRFWGLFSRKLANEITIEEDAELTQLLIAHPELHLQTDLFIKMWGEKDQDSSSEAAGAYVTHLLKHRNDFIEDGKELSGVNNEEQWDADTDNDSDSSNKGSFFSRRKKPLILGFSALAIFVVLFFVAKSYNSESTSKPLISSVSTKNGNRTKIMLPDGSQVWLNAGSKLDYDNNAFNKSVREISLTGEAYFDVVKNPAVPFIVHSGNMTVRVTGTAFNIKSYPDEKIMETSLIRGSVEVTLKNRPNEKYFLKPNEKFIASDEYPVVSKKAIDKEEAEEAASKTTPRANTGIKIEPLIRNKDKDSSLVETAWVYNRLEFHQNETFAEIAIQMERWYGVEIEFLDNKVSQYRLYGSFTTETITQALDALKMIARFNYKKEGNKISILK